MQLIACVLTYVASNTWHVQQRIKLVWKVQFLPVPRREQYISDNVNYIKSSRKVILFSHFTNSDFQIDQRTLQRGFSLTEITNASLHFIGPFD